MNSLTPIAAASFRQRPSMRLALSRLTLVWWAIGLGVLLTASWTLKDWSALRLLRLPDNDDMMRMAEIRDWLNGQRFNDLMQYRLGPPGGASMHWSRINDLVPAAIILILRPITGSYGAELAAAIGYPGLLLTSYLLIASRIAVRLGGGRAGPFALILAALAFPTISLMVPGRIDHHALQIVLTFVSIDAILSRPSVRSGAIAGLATALSMAVGLEGAPEIIAAMAMMGLFWLCGTEAEGRRAAGFGALLGGVTLGLLAFARPQVWPEQWCDGFTPASTRATITLAAGWVLLGVARPRLTSVRARVAAGAIVGAAAAAIAFHTSRVCFQGPYDALTPFLKQVWMSNVSEAKSLFVGQDTLGTSIAYGMLIFGGLAVTLVRVWRQRLTDLRWAGFALFMALSTVAAVWQIRVTYILAGIASIPFAIEIAQNRQAPLGRRLALWVCGAGVTWNVIAGQMDAAFAQPIEAARVAARRCTQGESIMPLNALPRGQVMAPIDLGSYLIGMTPHRVFAAGYHRNNAGNMAAYRFFLAKPDAAQEMARAWHVDYVALCPENMRETALAPYRPGSLLDRLQSNQPAPRWLQPIPVPARSSLLLYRVR